MPKASFTGVLQAAFVNIRIKAYPATVKRDEETILHYLHSDCVAPIRVQHVCTACGAVVTDASRIRGIQIPGADRYIPLPPLELSALAPEEQTPRVITIEQTVRGPEVNPAWVDRYYYLAPATDGDSRAYALLARGLRQEKLGAVVTFVSHRTSHLGIVTPDKSGLGLQTLCYADSVRTLDDYGLQSGAVDDLTKEEINVACDFVSALRSRFDHQQFHDTQKEKLMALVKAKQEGRAPESPPTSRHVSSLLEALKASTKQIAARKLKPKK